MTTSDPSSKSIIPPHPQGVVGSGIGASTIRPVQDHERLEAVRRLIPMAGQATTEQARQYVGYLKAIGVDLSHIYGRFGADGALLHSAMVIPQAGRTGLLFISPPRRPEECAGCSELINAACDGVPHSQVSLHQALLEISRDVAHVLTLQAIQGAEFRKMASLLYMERSLAEVGRAVDAQVRSPIALEFEPYRQELRGVFERMLQASYEKTLDCPELDGMRQTSDILDGHKAAGEFDPSLWTLARAAGEPVGVLLLNPVPGAGCVELVYLGIAAAHRGRGVGGALMTHGMGLIRGRKEKLVSLAVDDRNEPAMKLYRRWGFYVTGRKDAYMRAARKVGG